MTDDSNELEVVMNRKNLNTLLLVFAVLILTAGVLMQLFIFKPAA